VAHDRWLLEAVTGAVLELEGGRSTFFAGPWHVWREEKAARALHAGKAVERYEEDIARLRRFVERFRYKKTKAKQAQAKLTQISRLEKDRAKAKGELELRARLGHGVEPAYFSQQEIELPNTGSVLDAAQSATRLPRPQAQALLGRFLFSGWDEHEKPVAALSGGERRRLALALVVASGANFL